MKKWLFCLTLIALSVVSVVAQTAVAPEHPLAPLTDLIKTIWNFITGHPGIFGFILVAYEAVVRWVASPKTVSILTLLNRILSFLTAMFPDVKKRIDGTVTETF